MSRGTRRELARHAVAERKRAVGVLLVTRQSTGRNVMIDKIISTVPRPGDMLGIAQKSHTFHSSLHVLVGLPTRSLFLKVGACVEKG